MSAPTTIQSVLDRLDKTAPGGCWVWTGGKSSQGYGSVRMGGRTRKVHRLVYEYLVAAIPEGKEVDHLCRNKSCANPEHLEAVTKAENQRRGKNGLVLTGACRSGAHGPERWAWRADGRQFCRGCRDAGQAERTALLRQARGALGLSDSQYRKAYGTSMKKARQIIEDGYVHASPAEVVRRLSDREGMARALGDHQPEEAGHFGSGARFDGHEEWWLCPGCGWESEHAPYRDGAEARAHQIDALRAYFLGGEA